MKIFRTTSLAKTFLQSGSVITIGNFDGIHLGHSELIKKTRALAKNHRLKSGLLTFSPHPVKILAPEVAPDEINTERQKIEILSKTGLDFCVLQKFTKKLAKLTAKKFFAKYLVHELNAKHIVVGYDFTFGNKRMGTIETLEALGKENQVGIHAIDAKMSGSTLVSSSLIRKLVRSGNVGLANKLLTHSFFIDGNVIKGHNRGVALGLHTANLKTDNALIPADGVYATVVIIKHKTYKSVTNIGFNPTFDNAERSIETHIFDFDQKIYGEPLRLVFVKRLRDEIRFATPAALMKQIQIDIVEAKRCLKGFYDVSSP